MPKPDTHGRWKKRLAPAPASHLTEHHSVKRHIPGRTRPWLSHWLWALSLLVIVCGVLVVQSFHQRQAALTHLTAVEAAIEQLRMENQQLKEEIDALRHDPKLIERIAREELNMLRRDELVFSFPNKKDKTKAAEQTTSSPPKKKRK